MTFTRLTAAGLAGCLATGFAHLAYATVRTQAGHPGYTRGRVRCPSGNIIDHHVRAGRPGGPVVVGEAGLMSSSAAWLLVADHLDPDLTVVLYDRAGYRGSLRRCPEDYSLQESVADLAHLIRQVVDPAAPCVLTGHSLGGYLVHRAAAMLPDRVDAVVLADPTHPRELLHSRAQREGSRGVNLTLKLGPTSALFGAGLLIDKKGLFGFAEGSPYYRTLRIEASAVSTWRAARREWDYAYPFMLDGGRPLDRLPVPVRVVAAGATMRNTPEHRDLYEEYVASGDGGELSTVDGASHLSLIGGVEHAPHTARAIDEAARAASERRAGTERKVPS